MTPSYPPSTYGYLNPVPVRDYRAGAHERPLAGSNHAPKEPGRAWSFRRRRTPKIVAGATIIFRVSSSQAVVLRSIHIRRTFIRAEPTQRLAGDRFGHRMGAVELPVADLVACAIELRDDPSTAALDRKHPVVRPVGYEDGWLTLAARRHHESRRKSDHVSGQVAVGQSEREGVGCPVGEARYRQPPGIQCQTVERPLQRSFDELDVWAVAAHEHVPGPPSRLGREQDDPGSVGQVEKVGDAAPMRPQGAIVPQGCLIDPNS